MGILISMSKNRAIKKFARRLPSYLASGYGDSAYYTPGQVATAVESTGCNTDFLDYAYAMFCTQSAFNEVSHSNYDDCHLEVADLCFSGNSNFTPGDVASYSDGSGSSFGADGGGGD